MMASTRLTAAATTCTDNHPRMTQVDNLRVDMRELTRRQALDDFEAFRAAQDCPSIADGEGPPKDQYKRKRGQRENKGQKRMRMTLVGAKGLCTRHLKSLRAGSTAANNRA